MSTMRKMVSYCNPNSQLAVGLTGINVFQTLQHIASWVRRQVLLCLFPLLLHELAVPLSSINWFLLAPKLCASVQVTDALQDEVLDLFPVTHLSFD